MKKIINGRMYNTETAKFIACRDNGRSCSDFSYMEEALYRKRTGEFFLYGEGGAMSKYSVSYGDNSWGGGSEIIPLTEEKAKKWLERYADADIYIELFGEVEE